MNDLSGRKLEVGQNVVFSVGTKLTTGTIAYVRQRGTREVAKVFLSEPEKRYGQGRYLRNPDGTWARDENNSLVWVQGEEKTPLRHRDVHSSDRIMVLDPLTTSAEGVE